MKIFLKVLRLVVLVKPYHAYSILFLLQKRNIYMYISRLKVRKEKRMQRWFLDELYCEMTRLVTLKLFKFFPFCCDVCLFLFEIEKTVLVTSVSKKSGQTTVVIQYYSLSRFFLKQTL